MAQATIRLQTLDGGWEVVGKDRLRGIDPEGIQLTANPLGSDTCRFVLRRDPKAVYPDLLSFTPCEVEVGGTIVWSGRVWETPTKEGSDATISVEGRGWQYHLDDDVYANTFVHTRLAEWKDVRTLPSANLLKYVAAPQVGYGDGVLTFGWGGGMTMTTGTYSGVVLDLGPGEAAKRIIIDWEIGNPTTGNTLYAEAYATEPDAGNDTNATGTGNVALGTGTGTLDVTFAVAGRYVVLINYRNSTTATAAEQTVKVKKAFVFTSTAYESSRASILKASDVVVDALSHAPLLSQDTSRISSTSFNIPELFWQDYKTPREVINAVNAYHNYRVRVDVDQKLRFDPQPSAPKYESGAWQGVEFEDASANSGEEIYNRCVLQAVGPDDQPLVVPRSQLEAGSPYVVSASPAAQNPSADVNATGWSATSGSITRDTGVFHTGPASIAWATSTNGVMTVNMAGTFKAGRTYRLRTMVRGSGVILIALMKFGVTSSTDFASLSTQFTPSGSFGAFDLVWTPAADTSSATFTAQINTGTALTTWWDTFEVHVGSTLPDRRGFSRTMILPVESALTTAAGTQIADVFLTNHRTTPLRGSAAVTAGGLRFFGGASAAHPSLLLINAGELIRFSDRIDPDTGAVGRDGRVASVTYDHSQESASVAIDNERRNFEAMLSRLSALSALSR